MADGGIIFEVGMDVSQLEQDAGKALSNLKRFASKGASIISEFSKALGGNGKEFGYGILESISDIESKATSLIEKAIDIGAVFTDNERDTALFNNELLSLTEKLENYIKLYDELKNSDGAFNPDTKEINYLSDDDRKKLSDYSLKITELTSKIASLNAERAKVIAISNITDDDKQRIIEYANSVDELTLAENRLKKAQDALPELKLQYGEDSSEFINAALNMQKAQARVNKLKEDISRQGSIESGMKDAEKEANSINKKTLAMREYEAALRKLSEIRLDKGSESVEFAKQALQVQKLRAEIEKLANAEAMSEYSSTMSEMNTVTKTAAASLLSLWDKINTKQVQSLKDIEPAANKYCEALLSVAKLSVSTKNDMQSYKRTLDELAMEYNKAAAAGDEEAMAVIKQRYDEIANAAKRAANEIRNTTIAQDKNTNKPVFVPEASNSSISKWTSIKITIADVIGTASKLGSLLSPLLNKFKQLGSIASSALKKGMLAPIKLLLKPLKKVSSLFDRIKGILTRVVVMKTFRALMQSITKVINEQTEALYRWGKANNSGIGKQLVTVLDKLYTKLNYLKNTVAALFSTVITTYGPQVISFINKLIPIVNKVNATIASALGQENFLKAIEIPMSYEDYLDKSNKKAKELKRTLMGFDALNRLDGDTNTSEVDYSKMFKEAPVAKEDILSLEDVVKNFMSLPFDKWGTDIGNKFSDTIKRLTASLESISFTNVGAKIAEFFNGIIHSVDGVDVGHFIGEILTDIIEAIDGFIGELDTRDLGNDIAEIFTGIIDKLETIDWDKVFGDLIDGASDFISGFLNKMLEPDDNGDDAFVRLGLLLVDGVNTAFNKLKENDEVTQNIHDIFYGITETICTVLRGLDWKLIGSVILECIKAAFEGVNDADSTAGAITGLIVGGFAAIKIGTLISKIVKVFNGSALITGVFQTLKSMFSFDGIASFLSSGVGKAFAGIPMIISGVVLAVQNFIDMFKNGFNVVKEILMVLGTALAAVGAIILGAPAAVAAVVAGIVAAVATLVVVIKEHWEDIKKFFSNAGEWMSDKFDKVKEWFSNIPTFIHEKIESLKEKFKPLKEFFKGIWEDIKDGIKDFIKTGISYFENFVNGIIRGVNKIISALNGLRIDVPDWAEKISGVSSIGFNIPPIKEIKIPKLATGAVLPANNPFLAMVGDQKHGTNIEAPLDTIKQAVREELDHAVFSLYLENKLNIDGTPIYKNFVERHNQHVAITGKTPLKGV